MPADADDALEPEKGEEEKPKKKLNMKKLALFGSLGFLGLVLVGGGVAFMFGAFDSMLGIEREKTTAEIQLGAPVTVELPQIKADLKTGRCRSPFLRAIVAVQLGSHDEDKIEEHKTAILDAITTHLRDQERQDLVGKKGANQLRFDLVRILNNVIAPGRVHGVLFKEFLLQ